MVTQAQRLDLLNKANVIGVGRGLKKRGGVRGSEEVITVLVERKVPLYQLEPKDIVPASIGNHETDVLEVGTIHAPPPMRATSTYTRRHRPMYPGISVGHYRITAGTLGCVVLKDGTPHILSNNHVLANSNQAEIGDRILQPGPYDGGTIKVDTAALLADFVPISLSFTGVKCVVAESIRKLLNAAAGLFGSSVEFATVKKQTEPNTVDAAIANPTVGLEKDILNIGTPMGEGEVTLGDYVHKTGRTTGHTAGRVTTIHTTVTVNYGSGRRALFEEQIVAEGTGGPMSAGGDSGSAVLNEGNQVIGLLFAGSDGPNPITILNPIEDVLKLLKVEIA